MASFLKSVIKKIMYTIVIFTTVLGCFIVIGILFLITTNVSVKKTLDEEKDYSFVFGDKKSKNKLLSIVVSGIILGDTDTEEDPFTNIVEGPISYGYEIKRQLYEAAKDTSIKGIILQINSPGGTIYGSKAIADGVAYYKKKANKPVVSYIGGLGASGAYWAAVAGDYIIADFGSTIGSIGVLTGPFKYYDTVTSEEYGALVGGVVTQKGIETTIVTAGKSKDIGNPYRKLTKEEIDTLTRGVNNEYELFLQYVNERRGIGTNTLRNDIGALIYDNKTAQALKLIDESGSKEDVYSKLAQMARILNEDYQVVELLRPSGLIYSLLQSNLNVNNKKTLRLNICRFSSLVLAYHGDPTSLCNY